VTQFCLDSGMKSKRQRERVRRRRAWTD
jgi:hypothetical protein